MNLLQYIPFSGILKSLANLLSVGDYFEEIRQSIKDVNEHLTQVDDVNSKLLAGLHDITFNIFETMMEDDNFSEEFKGLVDKFKSNTIISAESASLLKMLHKEKDKLLKKDAAMAYMLSLVIAEVQLRTSELKEAERFDP